MKTLHNHIILYDAECPMCTLYTKVFVNTGMLDTTGRTAYQDTPEALCPLIDRQRAVNEIALVNTQTGKVEYGIQSLFKVIGNSFPVFRGLFNFGPFVWIAAKCYAFISYNRRVIVPGGQHGHTIQPSFSLKLRLAYSYAYLVNSRRCANAVCRFVNTHDNRRQRLLRIPDLRRANSFSGAYCKYVRG